jgi:putative phosphoesterase
MRGRAHAAPVVRTAAVTLPTRADGSVCLGVVADTHSLPHPATVELLRARSPDAILHAGDIGDLGVLEALAAIAPVHAVRGNIDVRAPNLPDELTIDLVHDGARVLRILLVHIAVNGPRLRADVARTAKAAGAELVVCGHSHVPFIGEDRGLVVFNPGSAGPRRFSLPIVFGTLALAESGLRLEHVSCETGVKWSPNGYG